MNSYSVVYQDKKTGKYAAFGFRAVCDDCARKKAIKRLLGRSVKIISITKIERKS